jgi:hypothetical protein
MQAGHGASYGVSTVAQHRASLERLVGAVLAGARPRDAESAPVTPARKKR